MEGAEDGGEAGATEVRTACERRGRRGRGARREHGGAGSREQEQGAGSRSREQGWSVPSMKKAWSDMQPPSLRVPHSLTHSLTHSRQVCVSRSISPPRSSFLALLRHVSALCALRR
eukprot:824879-Rhodomonas_salina.1